MGMAKRDDVILAAMGIVNACSDCEDKYDVSFDLSECSLRVEKLDVSLELMIGENDPDEVLKYADEANCTVQELTDEDLTDGAILCEGRLWEVLYYYQAGKKVWIDTDIVKELMSDINEVLRTTGFEMNLSSEGRIILMSEESMEAWRKREFNERMASVTR